ncbi:MAG: hypothetical protein ACREU5_06950 [Burkholderiales bacterium]
MRTIDEVVDQLSEIALELQEIACDDTTAGESRVLRAAGAQCDGTAAMLVALGEQMHASKVAALAAFCRCGHDRGEHLVDGPHGCEHVETMGADDGAEVVDPCMCGYFEAVHPPRPRQDTVPCVEAVV